MELIIYKNRWNYMMDHHVPSLNINNYQPIADFISSLPYLLLTAHIFTSTSNTSIILSMSTWVSFFFIRDKASSKKTKNNTIISPKKYNTSLIVGSQIYNCLINMIKNFPWVVCFNQDPNKAYTLQLVEDS